MEKSQILGVLGENPLLLPALINNALAANDRVKYYFSLLQAARTHGDQPQMRGPSLRSEREAAGIGDEALDQIVSASSKNAAGVYDVPGVHGLCGAIYRDLQRMLEPLSAGGNADWGAFAARLKVLAATAWCEGEDRISGAQIDAMTSGNRKSGDSLHLLVMDLHKALNAMQKEVATELIDGAQCYGLAAGDRPLVAAFMRGLNRTAPLKLDHPGLGTTATRQDETLILQNDIGTTDAHVLVIHVSARSAPDQTNAGDAQQELEQVEPAKRSPAHVREGQARGSPSMTVQVTYTDVHLQRLVFFQSLFEGWGTEWEDTRSRTEASLEDGIYHLCVGSYTTPRRKDLEDYLAHLGSRLVFLIDWNRARKRLRQLVPKKAALDLLKWAAKEEFGHLGFLRAGGDQMVYEALNFAVRAPLPPGVRLDTALGLEAASDFLRFVLRSCAEAALGRRSEGLVLDEIRAELASHYHRTQQGLVDLAAEQAALAIEIASGIRDCLLDPQADGANARFLRNAQRASAWEHEADELVTRARERDHQNGRSDFFRDLIEAADDVVDELEEAAFHLTLLPHEGSDGELFGPLGDLARLLVDGTQEYLRALETVRTLRPGGAREDMQEFLEAIHRIMRVERQSDVAQRSVKLSLARDAADFRRLYAFSECARGLEAAADALMHAGLRLRDHILAEATGR
jgi:uncharacterized protein Yka (UPF0111/DUF47 family)